MRLHHEAERCFHFNLFSPYLQPSRSSLVQKTWRIYYYILRTLFLWATDGRRFQRMKSRHLQWERCTFRHNATHWERHWPQPMSANVCQPSETLIVVQNAKRHFRSKAHTNEIVDIMQQIMAFELLICRQFQLIIGRLFVCALAIFMQNMISPQVHMIVFCTFDVCDSQFFCCSLFCASTPRTQPSTIVMWWTILTIIPIEIGILVPREFHNAVCFAAVIVNDYLSENALDVYVYHHFYDRKANARINDHLDPNMALLQNHHEFDKTPILSNRILSIPVTSNETTSINSNS